MLNETVLIGRLTKNIEIKKTSNGKSYALFTLAVTRNYKNQDGEYDADFINCRAWNNTAETVAEYTKKGDLIAVKGRLAVNRYTDTQGTTKYITEVSTERITFLQSARKTEQVEKKDEDPFADFGEQVNIDDNFLE